MSPAERKRQPSAVAWREPSAPPEPPRAPVYEARRVQPPDPPDGPDEVETYGDVAWTYWQQNGRHRGGIFGRGVHHPEHDCLTCADGRELAGRPPILPLLALEARRRMP